MAKEEKKVARKRFDEIIGVAKRHHLAKLLTTTKTKSRTVDMPRTA